jgi:hypothetical protein
LLGGKLACQYAAACLSTQPDVIVLNKLSIQGTFTASLPLLGLLLAAVAVRVF